METKTVIAISLVVLAAGCTQVPGVDGLTSGPNGEEPEESSPTDPGLEIVQFDISDNELRPEQTAVISLILKNHHVDPVTIETMELYNYNENGGWSLPDDSPGFEDNCAPNSLRPAQQGLSPEMECDWTIKAPTRDEIGSFESKSINPKLQLRYNSQVSNKDDPMKVQFMPAEDINQGTTISKTYENQEVSMEVSIDTPVPSGGVTTAEIIYESSGEGEVVSPYTLSISPDIVNSCRSTADITETSDGWEIDPVVDNKAEVTCRLSAETEESVERNLIFSTSYKYQKFPSLTIEVIN